MADMMISGRKIRNKPMKRREIIDNLKRRADNDKHIAMDAFKQGQYDLARYIKGEIAGLMIAIIMLEDGRE